MTVKVAVWAMIISSTLALLAVGVFVLVRLDSIVQWVGVDSTVARNIQNTIIQRIGDEFPENDFEAWLGPVNMAFQAMNAAVTFVGSKFVNKNLPVVAEANGQWHWVSFVTSLDKQSHILRVKRGEMTVSKVHSQKERDEHADKVITGHDIEMDGQQLDPRPAFNATDIIVGTLGTERIIFTYQYAGGAVDSGMSHLSFVRHAGNKPWFRIRREKSGLTLSDRFLVDGLLGKGEAFYFRTEDEAKALYKKKLDSMQAQDVGST